MKQEIESPTAQRAGVWTTEVERVGRKVDVLRRYADGQSVWEILRRDHPEVYAAVLDELSRTIGRNLDRREKNDGPPFVPDSKDMLRMVRHSALCMWTT